MLPPYFRKVVGPALCKLGDLRSRDKPEVVLVSAGVVLKGAVT
jgi:hypothetical protein